MQVLARIVHRVAVNMVNDFTRLGTRHLPVFPLASAPLRAIAKTFRLMRGGMRSVGLGDSGVRRGRHDQSGSGWRDHLVAPPLVFSGRHAVNLLIVRIQRVTVAVPHLIVPHAQLTRRDRPIAVQASAADHLPSPAVLRGAVPLDALVVHQAEPVSGVLAPAAVDSALHARILSKALGNSWAINCVRWVGRRIAMVDAIERREAA